MRRDEQHTGLACSGRFILAGNEEMVTL